MFEIYGKVALVHEYLVLVVSIENECNKISHIHVGFGRSVPYGFGVEEDE